MNRIPNTETVRHLCHFHGGSKYYLLSGSEIKVPILVTNVSNLTLLASELKSWCGMDLDVFCTEDTNDKTLNVLKNGTPLHLAFEKMTLIEE